MGRTRVPDLREDRPETRGHTPVIRSVIILSLHSGPLTNNKGSPDRFIWGPGGGGGGDVM